MLLNIGTKYKSLEPVQSPIELPDFVVLSGLNGSGKTQLLVAISLELIVLTEHNQHLRQVMFVDHNTLTPNEGIVVSSEELRQSSLNVINHYTGYKNQKIQNPNVQLRDPIRDHRYTRLIEKVAKNAGKDIDSLSNDDFFRYYPLEDGLEQSNIFYQSFSKIFKRYQIKQYENDFNQFRNQKYGNSFSFLSEEEFLEKYGEPPWLFINKVLKEGNLDYQVNSPENSNPDAPFELKLINKINGAEINFSDLSSGEKVIMSLSLSLYNSKSDMEFPKVILMDEPDSHLHPSMTKQFLDVIQNVFVGEKGVKVIITTHSPSTVALAPEETLFIMNKTEPRIAKTTKDSALQILTAGVPTLSVNYENRRQVFVESEYDAVCYGMIYEKLKDKLVPEISINFISSGIGGRGNCDQVKEVVNKLTGYGNHSVYGIIDWDTRNKGNEFVKVLGENKRYSIENYIFDPILLAAFLLREKFIDRDRIKFGLDEGDRYTDFNNFSDTKLQIIADSIVNQVRTKVDASHDTDLHETEYVCGRKIRLPSWFLKIQGHELEAFIKELFPQLKRFQREGVLKREIINKVIDDIPEFIPRDILIILSEIQNYQI